MITQVAIRYKGKIYSLPAPLRHYHVISVICYDSDRIVVDDEQGFLDDDGNFLNRVDALEHALKNNQVKDPDNIRAGQLFSEDLW